MKLFTHPMKFFFKGLPPLWLFQASLEIRNDLPVQRIERMRAIFFTSCQQWKNLEENPLKDGPGPQELYLLKMFRTYDWLSLRELRLRRKPGLLKRLLDGEKKPFTADRINRTRYQHTCRRLHHIAHEIQINLVTAIPLVDLETSMAGLLEDYESVTDPAIYQKTIDSPVNAYVKSTLAQSVAGLASEDAKDKSRYDAYLRAMARQLVTETRRNQLTKRQIEVIRDELYMVLAFTAVWMTLVMLILFRLTDWLRKHHHWWFGDLSKTGMQQAFLAGAGGIIGAYISAYMRIGDVSQSGVTARNLTQLGGAGKPLFQTTGFGCFAGMIFFLLIGYGGLTNFGPFSLGDSVTSTSIAQVNPLTRKEAADQALKEINDSSEKIPLLKSKAGAAKAKADEDVTKTTKDESNAPPESKEAATVRKNAATEAAANAQNSVSEIEKIEKDFHSLIESSKVLASELNQAKEADAISEKAEALEISRIQSYQLLTEARLLARENIPPQRIPKADLSLLVENWRKSKAEHDKQSRSYALFPLLLGILAGFSERLVPDVIDQFRKKKPTS